MDRTLTVKIKPSLLQRIEQKTKELETSTDTIINKALENYFYFERLNTLRNELKGIASKEGFMSEEDILSSIS